MVLMYFGTMCIAALIVVVIQVISSKTNETVKDNQIEVNQTEVNQTEVNQTTDSELIAQGLEVDKQAWKDFLTVYRNHKSLTNYVDYYSNGRTSKSYLNEYSKKLDSEAARFTFDFGKTEDEAAYLATFQKFQKEHRLAAQTIVKYLDSGAKEDLATAKKKISSAEEIALQAVNSRKEFLKKLGLSEDEIKAIANEAVSDMEQIDKE